MDNDYYYTIATPSEGLYKDKGSKFLAFAYPVSSAEKVKEIIDALRKKYYDARHICYAYILGADKASYRTNDDGEPSSTAGKPILGQINAFGLTDILIVVVRYFGGILLGTSGLITAYKTAAADALQNATIEKREITIPIHLSATYEQTNIIMRIVKENSAKITAQEYLDNTIITIQILRSQVEKITSTLRNNNIKIIE